MSKSLKYADDVISPIIQHNAFIANMTPKEKSDYLKIKYRLSHGKGKRKRKSKR